MSGLEFLFVPFQRWRGTFTQHQNAFRVWVGLFQWLSAHVAHKLRLALVFIRKSTSTIFRTHKKLPSFPLMFILTDGISAHLLNRAIHVSLFSRIHLSNKIWSPVMDPELSTKEGCTFQSMCMIWFSSKRVLFTSRHWYKKLWKCAYFNITAVGGKCLSPKPPLIAPNWTVPHR